MKKHLGWGNFKSWASSNKADKNSNDLSTMTGMCQAIDEFWDKLSVRCKQDQGGEKEMIYGTDISGSFFNENIQSDWNLNKFSERQSVIHTLPKDSHLIGIHTSLLFAGTNYSCFPLHAEDRYVAGINYNHWGAPKVWYTVHRKYEKEIRNLANGSIKKNECSNLLHHKCLLISPEALKKAGITYSVVRK